MQPSPLPALAIHAGPLCSTCSTCHQDCNERDLSKGGAVNTPFQKRWLALSSDGKVSSCCDFYFTSMTVFNVSLRSLQLRYYKDDQNAAIKGAIDLRHVSSITQSAGEDATRSAMLWRGLGASLRPSSTVSADEVAALLDSDDRTVDPPLDPPPPSVKPEMRELTLWTAAVLIVLPWSCNDR